MVVALGLMLDSMSATMLATMSAKMLIPRETPEKNVNTVPVTCIIKRWFFAPKFWAKKIPKKNDKFIKYNDIL